MGWFKVQLRRYRAWPRSKQVLFWLAFFAVCGIVGYSYMLLIGVPRLAAPSSGDDSAATARPLTV